jgi:hypothetical protein
MNILVDYENTNTAGLTGIDALTEDDRVEIYYSDKSDKMDMGAVETIYNSKCKVLLKKTEKTAPNYLDFHIVCRASQLLNTLDSVAIISKDKGYISVRDFYEKEGKNVILAESIGMFQSDVLTQTPAKTPAKTPVETPAQTSVEAFVKTLTETADKTEQKPKKKVSKISQTKKLSDEDKAELKEVLKDLPKHNGMLQQAVIDCFNECSTLGQIRYKLVSSVGRCDGEKAYKMIEKKFAEFKGLELKNT